MTTANDPIKNIQSRIDELEHTISDRSDQIRKRTVQLKEDLQEELSPLEIVRKHPLEATGASFVTGIVAGRMIRSLFGGRPRATAIQPQAQPTPQTAQPAEEKQPSAIGIALGAIGVELLHTAKDLGVTWLKSQVEGKKRKAS